MINKINTQFGVINIIVESREKLQISAGHFEGTISFKKTGLEFSRWRNPLLTVGGKLIQCTLVMEKTANSQWCVTFSHYSLVDKAGNILRNTISKNIKNIVECELHTKVVAWLETNSSHSSRRKKGNS